MSGMKGKTALVTGSAGGIGTAIVKALQGHGVTVAGADARTFSADHVFIGDLVDPCFCDGLPRRAAEAMGALDILVNNAGIITRGKITDPTDDDYARTMAIRVGAWPTWRHSLPAPTARNVRPTLIVSARAGIEATMILR